MLENPWSAVGNPTSALGSSGSSFGPSYLAPIGIHHLLLSNLTTGQYTLTTRMTQTDPRDALPHVLRVVYNNYTKMNAHSHKPATVVA